MKFKVEGRLHKNETDTNVSYTKTSRIKRTNTRDVYNLTLTGANYTDKARIVINETAKIDYEINCDASKFMSSNITVPQFYILENGQKFAIDERPLSDGVITLGTYFGQAGNYTISLSAGSHEGMCVILTDKLTGKNVDLTQESYSFIATQGASDTRFVVKITNAPTGIDTVVSDALDKKSAIYNLNGQQLSVPQKGINIINGNKTLVK